MNSPPERPVAETSISMNIPACGSNPRSSGMLRRPAENRCWRAAQKLRPRSSACSRPRERGDRCLLDKAGQPKQHAHRQVLCVTHECFRADEPAGAPAGHRMRLRQAPERHHSLWQARGKAWDAAPGGKPCINFVADRATGRVAPRAHR